MTQKKKDVFRVWTGFKFGAGFMLAAYFVMFLVEGLTGMAMVLFSIIMRGLGFTPGM